MVCLYGEKEGTQHVVLGNRGDREACLARICRNINILKDINIF